MELKEGIESRMANYFTVQRAMAARNASVPTDRGLDLPRPVTFCSVASGGQVVGDSQPQGTA